MIEDLMTLPRVSVITPCYRQGRFLKAAIECVLRQSYPNVESVVVNDGSDDDTDSVAAAYAGRITYVYQPNSGLPAARNAGINASRGQFLLFLDADDLLHPNAISWLMEEADTNENQLAVMGFRRFSRDPNVGKDETVPDGALLPRLFRENLAPPASYLCSADAVRSVGGFEQRVKALFGCEDWDLWIRLALAGAMGRIVPRVGAYYRVYEGSMSTNPVKMHRGRVEVMRRTCAAIRSRPELFERWGGEIPGMRRRAGGYWFDIGYHQATRGRIFHSFHGYTRALACRYPATRIVSGMLKAAPHLVARHVPSVALFGKSRKRADQGMPTTVNA
jgi:glycosyltransferase involved in cell wall biosynthesis